MTDFQPPCKYLCEISSLSLSQMNIQKQCRILGIVIHFNLVRRRKEGEERKYGKKNMCSY